MATARRHSPLMQNATYWIGMIMAAACVFLVLAKNTTLFSPLDSGFVPLSWVFGGLAIFAFAVYEHLDEVPFESEIEPETFHFDTSPASGV